MNSVPRGPLDGPISTRPYLGNDTREQEFPLASVAETKAVPIESFDLALGEQSFLEFRDLMLKQLVGSFVPQIVLVTGKTCLSCGAKTDPYGNLPCGH